MAEKRQLYTDGHPVLQVNSDPPPPLTYPPKAFIIKTAFQVCEDARTTPTPPMLAGSLFYQGELAILFAETSAGKSIFAVQIADALSRGVNVGPLRNEADPLKVVLFDFELSEKQFQTRYTKKDHPRPFPFHDNLLRPEMTDEAPPDGMTWEDYILKAFEEVINTVSPDVIILDNITYLEADQEKARKAAPLMKHLKHLKKKYNISVLAIAHTPKRNLANPITRNDLAGSKMLINFCDSAFAIGESASDPSLRYVKQIKTRAGEIVYHAENVLLASITQHDDGFTCFDFMGESSEREHLKDKTKQQLTDLDQKINEMQDAGHSYREIAKRLEVSLRKVQTAKKRRDETEAPF